MSTVPKTKGYLGWLVFAVAWFLTIPLWLEFLEPHQTLWNVFLTLILLGAVVGSFFGLRYLQTNAIEVGEARFDTTRKNDP
jgi:hypothetical protein